MPVFYSDLKWNGTLSTHDISIVHRFGVIIFSLLLRSRYQIKIWWNVVIVFFLPFPCTVSMSSVYCPDPNLFHTSDYWGRRQGMNCDIFCKINFSWELDASWTSTTAIAFHYTPLYIEKKSYVKRTHFISRRVLFRDMEMLWVNQWDMAHYTGLLMIFSIIAVTICPGITSGYVHSNGSLWWD